MAIPSNPAPRTLAALAATFLLAASAHADKAPKAPPPEPLPDPELHVRVVAPSAQGPWTLHLENEGTHWLRVPADVRLLHLSIESGDTMARRPPKPVKCSAPAGLRLDAFPERNALLLGPGDSYVEAFDPRLFCFGKDAKAIAGGALVRAYYGWELPARGVKKVEPPFAVEGTTFPAAVEPRKQLVAPSLVLSYLPPEPEEVPEAPPPPASAAPPVIHAAAPPEDVDPDGPPDEEAAAEEAPAPAPVVAENAAPPAPPDENAPRFELKATPYADAIDGFKVSITVTATNVGHRAATAAILTRMVGFRVEGPDGTVHCHAARPTHALPREAYRVIKPGGSTAITLLVEEACRQELFRRPGLYHVRPSLHLNEDGSEAHLEALTGTVRALEPTLVRILSGPEPFYRQAPQAIRAPRAEGDAHDPH